MSRPVLFAVDENQESLRAIEAELRDRYERGYRVACVGSGPEAKGGAGAAGGHGRGRGPGPRRRAARRGVGERAARGSAEVVPAGPARPADRLRQLGPRGDRQGHLRGDGAAPDRLLRDPADPFPGRALPPGDLDLPARVAALPPPLPAHRLHRRRILVGAGARAARGARPLRPAAQILPRRFGGGPGGGRRGRRDGEAAAGRVPERRVPGRPEQRRADRSGRRPGRSRGPRIRPGHRRGRPGRALGGGLRRLGRAAHAGDRLRRDRRPGDPEFLVRNYLGFPRGVSGRQLAELAYEQAWVFGTRFAFMQTATGLRREGGRIFIGLSDFPEVEARAVVLAGGAAYRRLEVGGLEGLALKGAGVFYGSTATEAPAMEGREVFVVVGANSAGQAALHLADYARRVTLVVRADSLATGMSHYLVEQVEAAPNIEVRLRTEVVGGGGEAALEELELRDRDGGTDETVPADALFVMIGARPNTGWLPVEILRDSGGFVRTGQTLMTEPEWNLGRAPFSLETSMPGVFAVGDVRNGSMSRVAAAVGEGSIAVRLVHELFAAERLVSTGRDPVFDSRLMP